MVHGVSISVYREIVSNGLLSERRLAAYIALRAHGPGTASEICKRADWVKHQVNNNIRARLNELREAGVAFELDHRICGVTGHTAIVWAVADRLPVKPTKRKRGAVFCARCKEEIRCQPLKNSGSNQDRSP